MTGATGAVGSSGPTGGTGQLGAGGENLFTQTNNVIYPYPVVNRSIALGSSTFSPLDDPSITATASALILLNGDTGMISARDLTLGLNDTTATLTTQDTNETLTIDPNGTGSLFFHGSTYQLTSTGDFVAQSFQDSANTAYFLDPAGTGVSLNIAGDATISGKLTIGNTQVIRPAYGPLTLQYKSGLDAWAAGLTLQDTTGNVGVGTTSPGLQLEVKGSSGLNGNPILRLLDSRTTGAIDTGAGMYFTGHDGSAQRDFALINGSKENGTVGNYASYLAFWTRANGAALVEAMRINSAGNVGIGTTAPIAQTEIYGTGQLTAALTDAGTRTGTLALNSSSSNSGAGGAIVFGNSQSETAGSLGFAAIKGLLNSGSTNTRGDLAFSTRNAVSDTQLTERMRIRYDGNVGIGITAPDQKLTIQGSTTDTPFNIRSSATNNGLYLLSTTASSAFLIGGAEWVSSAWTARTTTSSQVVLANGDTFFRNNTGLTDGNTFATTETMRIVGSTGNVGIGTTDPDSGLQVSNGGLCVGSNVNCNTDNNTIGVVYSSSASMTVYDVAENYPTRDLMVGPEEVVVLDPDNGVFVKKSTGAPGEKVLGVISANPAVYLGGFNGAQYKEEKQVAVGLSGRIPVKVTTEGGNIRIGDPLTTSSIPGVAKKATSGGFVIGKALEDYNNDNPTFIGSIQFFINLTWYDPNLTLTTTGDLQIVGQEGNYAVTTPDQTIVERIGAFAELVVGALRVGVVTTQELVADSVVVGGQNLRDYILSVVAEATVTSPLATIEELHTDTISPLSPESPGITVPLGDTQTFAVTDAEGTPTTSFDSVGNATIAGTLTVSQDATIAGTLYADRIVTGEGEITPSTESATFVTNVTNVTYATPAGELATTSALFALGATVSGDGGSHIQISKDVTLTSSLAVFGETLLGTTAIAGGIDIDGTVHIGTNGIESFGDTLYIQRSKLANLDIMDGVLVIQA